MRRARGFCTSVLFIFQVGKGRSQKSGNGGGAKSLDRKPHLLINYETGSDYYSKNAEQRNVDELGVTVEVTGASYSLGESEPT